MEEMDFGSVEPEELVGGALRGISEILSLSDDTHEYSIERRKLFRHCRNSVVSERGRNSYLRLKDQLRLMRAASLNDVDRVKSILLAGRVNPNEPDGQGRRALHIAASRGYDQVVLALIKAGADPNLEDHLGNTPLHLAVYTGSLETIVHLIAGGCRVRRTTLVPHTPLELARSKYNMLKKQKDCVVSRLQVFRVILLLRHAVLVDVIKASQQNDVESLMGDLAALELQESSSPTDKDSDMP